MSKVLAWTYTPLVGLGLLASLACGDVGEDAQLDAFVDDQIGSVDDAIIYGTEYPDFAIRNYAIPALVVLDENGNRPVLPGTNEPSITCSSTLLDNRWVVTAAHCIRRSMDMNNDGRVDVPTDVLVRFGNINDPLAVERTAELVIEHPDGQFGSADGVDVALIRLASDAPQLSVPTNHFTNGRMAIYGGPNSSLVGRNLTLAGYGKSIPIRGDDNGDWTGVGVFRTSFLSVTSAGDRLISFSKSSPTGLINQGDSGGPTLYDIRNADSTLAARFLTGVASMGDGVRWSAYIGSQAFREWVSKTAWGKIKPASILAHSGFSNPNNLIDGNVDTVSVDNDTTASVEFNLGDMYRVTEVRLAEDNYQQWKVYSYSVQCWTGSSWGPVLFNDTSTNVAKPRFDEHPIPNPCTTNRLKVNFENPEGPVEVFEFEMYGAVTGTRTLTIGASTPSFCSSSPGPGNISLPVGSDQQICANSCSNQVFDRWNVSGDVWVENAKAACTRVRSLQANGTVSPVYRPEFVNVTVVGDPNARIQTGSHTLPYNTLLEFAVAPNAGYYADGCIYPEPGFGSCSHNPDTSMMSTRVTVDGTITPIIRRNQVPITSLVKSGGVGNISPDGGHLYDEGSNVTFNFTPGTGYRVSEVCPSRFPDCLPWAQNSYTLTDVGAEGVNDFWFWVGFEYANYRSRANSAMCLDAAGAGTGNGTQIQLWDCHANGHPAQWYYLRQLQAGQFEIRNGGSNRCVDIAGGSTSTTAKVQLWDCNNSNAQRFQLVDTGNPYARLQRVGTNLCLEAIGTGRNALIQQRTCSASNAQQWRIPR